jgi:ferric-dicitrate binding protein FerR (iron transport regulator)
MIRKLTRVPYLIKYASVAAIVTIVVGVSYVMLNSGSVKEQYILAANERQRLEQTGDSQTKEIELPDGTKIHMNCNSGIEYIQKEFNREKREIWLEGEAYFDVTKQPDRPFIIHSKDITTTVHGTSFNIKAYDSIGEISITVKTGKVEISSGPSVLGLLTPNKQLIYRNETQTHAIANRNWDDVSAWMEKRLVLCDANVNELKIRLKQIYGIEIIVENNALSNSVLNASYPAGTKINSVLQGIGEIYNINYAIDEKKKTARIY